MPRCRRGHYSFPWIAPFTLDPYLLMLSVKQGSIKYHFLSLWYGTEPQGPGPLANTLTIMPMGQYQIELFKNYWYSVGQCAKKALKKTTIQKCK